VKWWHASRRSQDWAHEPPSPQKPESEPLPPQKLDGILALQRSIGNQAVQKLLPHAEGEPLPAGERQDLEAAFGKDLSEVRVHRDQEAADLAAAAGAKAFTTGRDIYFAPGGYGPDTLAHEVTHVIQQGQAASHAPGEDATLEHQAVEASSAVMSGHVAEVSSPLTAPSMQRQPQTGTQQSSLTLMPTYSLTLDNFDTDKFNLKPGHTEKLDHFAERLKNTLSSSPSTVITIVGFADAPGTELHNLGLGQQRAKAVREYLIGKGVPADALYASSLGEHVPVVETKGHEPRNRRVEIHVVERSSFKPFLELAPSTSVKLPQVVTPTEPDITHHFYRFHVPTPSEQYQQKQHEIDQAVREAAEAEKAKPGTSIADFFGKVGRDVAKKLGLPQWVQDGFESLAKDAPSKGAQAVYDQIAAGKNPDANTQNAIKALIDALMQLKVR
jgi:outer membrane protein OmpA-like peptidoglycan-associated protein